MTDRAISGEPYRLDKALGAAVSAVHADSVVGHMASGLAWTAPEIRVQNITADPTLAGNGMVSGTVDTAALPLNLPVSRPVRLYREDTGVLVSSMQSGADGTYSFKGLPLSMQFAVVAIDTRHLYNAVILDNITPDAMP
jgi:hypothetical protein